MTKEELLALKPGPTIKRNDPYPTPKVSVEAKKVVLTCHDLQKRDAKMDAFWYPDKTHEYLKGKYDVDKFNIKKILDLKDLLEQKRGINLTIEEIMPSLLNKLICYADIQKDIIDLLKRHLEITCNQQISYFLTTKSEDEILEMFDKVRYLPEEKNNIKLPTHEKYDIWDTVSYYSEVKWVGNYLENVYQISNNIKRLIEVKDAIEISDNVDITYDELITILCKLMNYVDIKDWLGMFAFKASLVLDNLLNYFLYLKSNEDIVQLYNQEVSKGEIIGIKRIKERKPYAERKKELSDCLDELKRYAKMN